MTIAYLSLGSNLGDRMAYLAAATRHIGGEGHTRVLRASSVYETAPQGKLDQPAFLNLVLEAKTDLEPHDLLRHILAVEQQLGRLRVERWGPRTVDIDILLYGDRVITEGELEVPHPRMADRAFVLVPLLELNPAVALPAAAGGRPLAHLLAALPDQGVTLFAHVATFQAQIRGVQ